MGGWSHHWSYAEYSHADHCVSSCVSVEEEEESLTTQTVRQHPSVMYSIVHVDNTKHDILLCVFVGLTRILERGVSHSVIQMIFITGIPEHHNCMKNISPSSYRRSLSTPTLLMLLKTTCTVQ